MSAHRERNSRSSAAADAAAAAAAAATPPAPVPSHAAASASGPASILVGSPLRKAMQASVKLIGAGAFLVYMLGGAEKFAFLTSGGAQRPWFLLDAPSCVMLALLLAYVPHWIRTFGVVRPKLARAGTPYDLRYTRLCTQVRVSSSSRAVYNNYFYKTVVVPMRSKPCPFSEMNVLCALQFHHVLLFVFNTERDRHERRGTLDCAPHRVPPERTRGICILWRRCRHGAHVARLQRAR